MGEPAWVRDASVGTALAPFEAFFDAEYARLCEALVLLTSDPFDAEDLAQEAMTRVLERWDRVGSMDSPTGYLFRTAMNLNRNRVRKMFARARRPFHDDATAPDHGSIVSDQHDVRLALAKVSRAEREALVLIDWLQMDAGEAAVVLGISAGAVRVRLHRGRAALRRHLGENDDE